MSTRSPQTELENLRNASPAEIGAVLRRREWFDSMDQPCRDKCVGEVLAGTAALPARAAAEALAGILLRWQLNARLLLDRSSGLAGVG